MVKGWQGPPFQSFISLGVPMRTRLPTWHPLPAGIPEKSRGESYHSSPTCTTSLPPQISSSLAPVAWFPRSRPPRRPPSSSRVSSARPDISLGSAQVLTAAGAAVTVPESDLAEPGRSGQPPSRRP